MVYKPEAIVPDQEVSVARGTVDVGHQGVEPDDSRGEVGIGRLYERVEPERARQVVQRQVQARASFQQVLYLGVRFRAAQLGGEIGEHDFGHQETEAARDLPGHQLGHQRFAALPGPAELEDVGPEIVRLDDRRQRTPLTQGRYVSRRSDRPEQAEYLGVDIIGGGSFTYSTGSCTARWRLEVRFCQLHDREDALRMGLAEQREVCPRHAAGKTTPPESLQEQGPRALRPADRNLRRR